MGTRGRRRATPALGAAATLALVACGSDGGAVDPPPVEPDPAVVATLEVNPQLYTLSVLGSSVTLIARARDGAGSVLCYAAALGCAPTLLDGPAEWATDDPGVVSMRPWEGSESVSRADFTALAEGRVEVTASVQGVEATAVVEVEERARVVWSLPAAGASAGIAIGEDGTIYVAGRSGLQAVGPEGDLRWTVPAGASGLPAIAGDGTLYLGTGAGLMAIGPDGTTLWVNPIQRIWSPPALGPDGTIYQGTSDGILHAVDPAGQILWRFEAPGPASRNPSAPAIGEDGTVYFGSENGHLYAIDPDGTELWRFQTAGPVRSPSIGVDGTLYFANDRITEWSTTAGLVILAHSRMFALTPDGTEIWSAGLEGDVWSGPAINFNGSVYQSTYNGGQTYVFSPDGELVGTVASASSHTPIIAADGSLYYSFLSVSAFDPDGLLKWRFEPENAANPTPAIGFDGRIYGQASDRFQAQTLYAFEELGANNGGYRAAPWPQERGDRANTGRARRP